MYYDRFDIIEAHYSFYVDYHSGQGSEFYERQCKIRDYYKPSINWNGYDSLTNNGQDIYDQLVNIHEYTWTSIQEIDHDF
jgi:hypothetical protein